MKCPACGRSSTTNLGHMRSMQGILHLPSSTDLYRCAVCKLHFRYPYPPNSSLIDAYAESPVAPSQNTRSRPDFNMVAEIIRDSFPSGSILDVGCHRGDFLMMLPRNYQKYGIEPSKAACRIARERGITIIGASVEDLKINPPPFQVVTLLDVIEHLSNPLLSLRNFAKLLSPEGMLIVTTGNTDALLWRLMRCDYWYYYAEHVSFFSPSWFKWAANETDLCVSRVRKFSRFKGSTLARWCQVVRCVIYLAVRCGCRFPLLNRLMGSIYPFNRACKWPLVPTANLSRDHMLIVLRRSAQPNSSGSVQGVV